MARPKMLGTINGFSVCNAKFGRKKFTFNGTVKGLVESALAVGAQVGDKIKADFGGGYFREYTLYSNPKDDRVGGVWATEYPNV